MLKWYNQSTEFVQILGYANLLFTGIFVFESIIKIIALGRLYFKDNWNIFDFVIIWISVAIDIFDLNYQIKIAGATTIVMIFRVARIIRLVKRARSLKLVLNTFLVTLPAVANVGSLLLLILYLFSILGVQLFSQVKRSGFLNDQANFESFRTAFLTLFIFATGDSWD